MSSDEIPNQVERMQEEEMISNARKTAEKFLDTVVNTIVIRQRRNKNNESVKQSPKYPQLFSNITEMFEQFDATIGECKRYNEAKIHRRYEIRIQDLEQQIKILTDKIQQEQKARAPSKKYVEQLVDQLVVYKDENQKLRDQIKTVQEKYEQIKNNLQYVEGGESKAITISQGKNKEYFDNSIFSLQEQENPQISNYLADQVTQYLKMRHSERKIRPGKKSKFQLFLKKSRDQLLTWDLNDLLEGIDDWSKQIQNAYENQKLKSNIISNFEDSNSILNDHRKLPVLNHVSTMKNAVKNLGGGIQPFRQGKYRIQRPDEKARKYHSTIQVIQRTPKYKIM